MGRWMVSTDEALSLQSLEIVKVPWHGMAQIFPVAGRLHAVRREGKEVYCYEDGLWITAGLFGE